MPELTFDEACNCRSPARPLHSTLGLATCESCGKVLPAPSPDDVQGHAKAGLWELTRLHLARARASGRDIHLD